MKPDEVDTKNEEAEEPEEPKQEVVQEPEIQEE
jgi:hypothetical protein